MIPGASTSPQASSYPSRRAELPTSPWPTASATINQFHIKAYLPKNYFPQIGVFCQNYASFVRF
jgi:hypothetical protein